MTQHAVLNNVDHKDLRVVTDHGEQWGDGVQCALTFAAELLQIQGHYPVFFVADKSNNTFHALAMFGFAENENLFLGSSGWDAPYLPLSLALKPFLIGRSGDAELTVHIDMESPRISQSEGEPLFLPHGGTSPFLDDVSDKLATLHQGLEQNAAFVAAMKDHDLLEPFTLDVEFVDGTNTHFAGYYTINEEKLDTLDPSALADLQKTGFLKAAYMAVASMVQIRTLIERRNAMIISGPA